MGAAKRRSETQKGRNIIAQVDRPGYTMYAVTPACKVGTKTTLTMRYFNNTILQCADLQAG